MTTVLHKIISSLLKNRIPESQVPPQYKELTETVTFYHTTISDHLSYYNKLPDALKLRFLKRVYFFRNEKEFHYINLEAKPEMPVLISASAVQVTFGLRTYLLPFFKNIYLTDDAYYAKDVEGLNVGHVSTTGIYISWKYFLEGFKNDWDGVNTALHEMAHALRHQNNMRQFGIDKEFETDFAKYTQQYGPVLIQALLTRRSFLRNYAFTNFEEFWAVSVEAFFEMPAELKTYLPDLYKALCEVLNQDPLTDKKIIAASVAKQ
jgi:Mlc titration factor MtfA (ptsG expression regulator)